MDVGAIPGNQPVEIQACQELLLTAPTLVVSLLVLVLLLRPVQIEAVVSQRFGSAACRIFRLLQQKKCLEQKQVLFN